MSTSSDESHHTYSGEDEPYAFQGQEEDFEVSDSRTPSPELEVVQEDDHQVALPLAILPSAIQAIRPSKKVKSVKKASIVPDIKVAKDPSDDHDRPLSVRRKRLEKIGLIQGVNPIERADTRETGHIPESVDEPTDTDEEEGEEGDVEDEEEEGANKI